MTPTSINLNEQITISGIMTRTNNSDELNQDTAKIGSLWNNFFATIEPVRISKSIIYGVYHNYENDATGNYDLLVGIEQKIEHLTPAIEVTIPSGTYLQFKKEGNFPETVISLWQEIWTFFDKHNCPYKRAYNYDYEKYTGADKIEIYISIT